MPTVSARSLLVKMLHEAASLEHCLLNSYLYAAASLKATPQEWQTVAGQENRRRAVQFERARLWKANILGVAHEEMRHLHYVQCLIRALGERPYLGLPRRNKDGVWTIGNWKARIGDAPPPENGTEIPVAPLDRNMIRNFILYESTDALQDEDPFGPAAIDLYERLYDFEFSLRIESMLTVVPQGPEKETLKASLRQLYLELEPVEREKLVALGIAEAADMSLSAKRIRFQSIADLYLQGILPLYQEAFESGWVTVTDRNLIDEQLDPQYAQEGFLPIGPIFRSARFSRFSAKNTQDPLRDYKRVDDIIKEIVEEGEGAALFRQRAEAMLAKVKEIGVSGFLQAATIDAGHNPPDYKTPKWLATAQLVRHSHLYTFATIYVEYEQEAKLATQAGVPFEAARAALAPSTPELRKLKTELPAQFNAAYLGMLAWLARMYESREWASDKPRRMAIEMLATWPLMSLAIRPMLELAGLVGPELSALFRFGGEDVPDLPVWAQELAALYASTERSEAINAQMDRLIVRTLRGVADWAHQLAATMTGNMPADPRGSLVLTRLTALSRLGEFERQFPFRVAGGYSNRLPDLSYVNAHPHADSFSEAPSLTPLFADTPVLRFRFRGWGLVQLATDPDPPTDEVGVSGTLMLHAADGNRRFDRALVWQDFEPELNIRRSAPDAPPLGIQVCEVALMMPDRLQGATAGYVPLGQMNSTGAVQTTGTQQILKIDGLRLLGRLDTAALDAAFHSLGVFLESKDSVRPFLVGENHLVWQDGEPIDPFILSVYALGEKSHSLLLSREVYNRGLSVERMEPYDRLLTSRAPCGFDSVANIPPWAMTPELTTMVKAPGYPGSFLKRRATGLVSDLVAGTKVEKWSQQAVDTVISLAERCVRVTQPAGTTVAWLRFLLHYGHTISGDWAARANPDPLLNALLGVTGLQLKPLTVKDRKAVNSRWLANYTKGVMDVDAISDFVYGELYVPLEVTGGNPQFARTWSFPASMADALRSYALDFAKPFWATFDVKGNVRTTTVMGLVIDQPGSSTTITETLLEADKDGYRYAVADVLGVNQTGGFSLVITDDQAHLAWSCSYTANDSAYLTRWMALLSDAADLMEAKLTAQFAPKS